jgi:hypothetical protein
MVAAETARSCHEVECMAEMPGFLHFLLASPGSDTDDSLVKKLPASSVASSQPVAAVEERSTAELILILGEDIDRCHRRLIQAIDAGTVEPNGDVSADYEFHARQLIRAIFAFIEAVTFSIKVRAAAYCLAKKRDISDGERYFSVDLEHGLTDKGQVVDRPAHIRLADNIRFAFALQEKALGCAAVFDPAAKWWSCLKSSIKVRDRLTHPKLPGDIDIDGDEIIAALEAYNGFKSQAMAYARLRDSRQRSRKVRGRVP